VESAENRAYLSKLAHFVRSLRTKKDYDFA